MNLEPRVVLASASPRRKALLGQVLREFLVIPSCVDEAAPEGVAPTDAAARAAFAKAEEVAGRVEEALVLAADTVVDFEGTLMGKPRDASDAFEMLSRLSGAPHRVVTALVAWDARR